MSFSRRHFMVGAIAGVAGVALSSSSLLGQAPNAGPKQLTLLHLTDTHAQLETHPEHAGSVTGDPANGRVCPLEDGDREPIDVICRLRGTNDA
jgi:2',3'-cyclic-nucleotide 2'-phosphodiesterase (5'-nucleotidase family)